MKARPGAAKLSPGETWNGGNAAMAGIRDLVDEWRAMKSRLEQQLELLDDDFHTRHGPTPRDAIRRWIVELDDLIIKYAFEI
jgi:hypothetical protein